MKKFSLFFILDNFFKFILLFFINLIWTLYFINQTNISVLLSLVFSIFILFILNKVENKHNTKKNISKQEYNHILQCRDTFIIMSKKDTLNFFYKLANTKHETELKSKYVMINNNKKYIALIPVFSVENLSCDKLIEQYNTVLEGEPNKLITKIIILCNQYDDKCLQYLQNFSTKTLILDYKMCYFQLLKEYSFFPKIITNKKTTVKKSFKYYLDIAFDKKRTKSYFLSALFIFFCSFFVIYRFYYLIIATLLFICAFICKYKNKNVITSTKLLD